MQLTVLPSIFDADAPVTDASLGSAPAGFEQASPGVYPQDHRYEQAQQQLLAKIEDIYIAQRARREQKRLQQLIKYRRQLTIAEAAFRQDLACAISRLTREGLGMQVLLNSQAAPGPEFVAEFEFYGQRWRLTRKRTWRGCQWTLWQAQGLSVVCRASARHIESQLCYLLGRYCHATTHRLGVTLLPAAAS